MVTFSVIFSMVMYIALEIHISFLIKQIDVHSIKSYYFDSIA